MILSSDAGQWHRTIAHSQPCSHNRKPLISLLNVILLSYGHDVFGVLNVFLPDDIFNL